MSYPTLEATAEALADVIRAMNVVPRPEGVRRFGLTSGLYGFIYCDIIVDGRTEMVSAHVDSRAPDEVTLELVGRIEAKRAEMTAAVIAAEAEFGRHFASIAA